RFCADAFLPAEAAALRDEVRYALSGIGTAHEVLLGHDCRMPSSGFHRVGVVQRGIPPSRAEDPRRHSERVSGNEAVTEGVKWLNKSSSYVRFRRGHRLLRFMAGVSS